MRMTIALLGAVAGVGLALAGPATAASFITNGGFEDGAVTQGTTNDVPTGWTANSADGEGFFGVTNVTPHSGTYDLQIGDYDNLPVEMVSQTFSDLAGGLYTATFYGLRQGNGDPNAYLSVSAGGQTDTLVEDAANDDAYEQGTFTFVGTGSDTLTIAARTNPGDWFAETSIYPLRLIAFAPFKIPTAARAHCGTCGLIAPA